MANTELTKVTFPTSDYIDLNKYRKLTNNDFDSINVTELNAGDLIVTGVGRFTNGLYGNLIGNADTATTATNLSGFTNTTTTGTAIDSATQNGHVYVTGTSGIYSQNDGAAFVQAYSTSWVGQIYQDYRTGQIALRGKNNGTWQAWRKVWDSVNLTSKTASASGTDLSLVTTGEKATWNAKGSGTITSVKTTAGAHTTINVTSGAANFNIPTKTSHLTNDSGFVTQDTKNTAGSTDTSSKIFLIGATSQAANPQTYSDDQVYVTSGTLQTNNTYATVSLCANTGNSGTAGGVSLYGSSPTAYGLAMRGTGNGGKHGAVQGDWAIYSYMNGYNTARGWIWRNSYSNNTNIASLDVYGNAVFNGYVGIGGNETNTSGVRQVYNSTTKSLDFVFVA